MTQQATITLVNELTGVASCCIVNEVTGIPRVYKITQTRDELREGDKVKIFALSTNWAKLVEILK